MGRQRPHSAMFFISASPGCRFCALRGGAGAGPRAPAPGQPRPTPPTPSSEAPHNRHANALTNTCHDLSVSRRLTFFRPFACIQNIFIARDASKMFRRCAPRAMKYANLELTTRGEFPHGMKEPGFVKKLDKNIPWYFSTYRSMYHWPVLGDNWSDLNEQQKHNDLHMFYTLAWWKLGEGVFDADDEDR